MNSLLTNHYDFVDGFVKQCFDKGFNEEQTHRLLKTASLNELAESNDPDFHEGLRIGSSDKYTTLYSIKQAFSLPKWLAGLGKGSGKGATKPYTFTIPRGVGNVGMRGAGSAILGGAGGAMFGDPENSMAQNVLTGAGLGAGLRLMGGPMFKGKNFSKFVSGMNPFTSIPAVAKGKGGVPRGTIGLNLLRPVETLGKAMFHKGVPSALATGAAYGALGGGAYSLASGAGVGKGINDSSQLLPYYMQGSAGSGGSSSGGSSGPRDIFALPGSLKEIYQGKGSGAGISAGTMAMGPLHEISQARAKQNMIDRDIAAITSQMGSLNEADPMSVMRRMQLNKQLVKLQAERNATQKSIESSLDIAQQDRSRYRQRANTAYSDASSAVEKLTAELRGNVDNLSAGQGSTFQSILNKLNPMNWAYGGLENRINRNAEQLAQQQYILQQAQKAQSMLH